MHEISRVTEDTTINSEETKELIKRLSDPSFVTANNQATVKDLAETLDLDPQIVATGLERLRQEKLIPVPESSETNRNDQFVGNRPYARTASIMIAVAVAIAMLCFFLLFQQPAMTAPPAPTVVQTAPVQPATETAPTPPPK